jgi:pimeloyl-ACP methyl ester carboxylesterase
VLAVDLPGHRSSAGPALPDVESLADWTLALMDVAGVATAVLGGHSMGSLIALEAAGRAPQRVSRLLMFGSAYPMRVSPALLDASLNNPAKAIEQVVAFSHSTLAPKPSFPGPGAWVRGASCALMHQVLRAQGDARLFHTDFLACDRYAGAQAAAARVTAPAHLILGRLDQMTPPRSAGDLGQWLNARVHIVPAGHQLMAEAPEAVLEAVRQSLA